MKQVFTWFICAICTSLFGQLDTAIWLPSVTIEAINPIEQRQGIVHSWQTDSLISRLYQWENIGQILQNSGLISIRDNGNGALATINLRGTGAAHTQVMWQGGAFQNPMNGVADLSLIPAGHFGRVSVLAGSVSSSIGSGGIGGVILLSPEAPPSTPFSLNIGLNVGSFGTKNLKIGIENRHKNWSQQTSYIRREAKNNITFQNTTLINRPTQTLENAHILQHSLVHESRWQPTNSQVFKLSIWAMKADRQLAPSMTEANSHAQQNDRRIQTAASHSWAIKNGKWWQNRVSYTSEDLIFGSDFVMPSLTKAQSAQFESLFHWPINAKIISDFGAKTALQSAFAPEYVGQKARQRHISETFLTGRYDQKYFSIIGNIRQGITDKKWQPIQPAITAECRKDKTKIAVKAARHFAQPTLNDLYWFDGFARGNANLLPELGWAFEAGIQQKIARNNYFDATLYSSSLQNWIQWVQQQGIWQPQNVKSVWSRGAEFGTTWHNDNPKIKTRHTLRGNLVIATNTDAHLSAAQNTVGKQLIYTPRITLTGLHHVAFRQWQAAYQQQFYGNRFTTTDNATSLSAYYLADLTLMRDFRFKKCRLESSVACKNIWNSTYQVMAYRPMPGRNIMLSVCLLY